MMKEAMYTLVIEKHKTREELRRQAADAVFTAVTTVVMVGGLALAAFGLGAMMG